MLSVSNQREPSPQSTTSTSVWTRRLIILLAILAAIALAAVVLWGASHMITTLLIFVVAALIAYAIAPVVGLLQRVIPRAVAILAVYLIAVILLAFLLYLLISTLVPQLASLAQDVGKLFTPGSNGQDSSVVKILLSVGLTRNQIQGIGQQLGQQLTKIAGTVTSGIVPLLGNLVTGVTSVFLTTVSSIYLLVDGSRATGWLRNRTPASQRGRISSLLTTVQNVVGSYIRGQLALSLIICIIVGGGMAFFGLGSYAVFIGVLSFFTEFIPVLGVIICGAAAVLLALTHGWLTAILVLAYFVLVNLVEGYILGPRLVGKAVGLHPLISLLAVTLGAELFGLWGAIFAAPVAGVLQAFTTALWDNYRRTHSDEFPPEEQALADKRPEEPTAPAVTPAFPAIDGTVMNE